MPRPRTPKEIKQFLGLTGYYRKFIPHFSEISRPLVKLTAKDTQFEWTPHCQISFEMLKEALMSTPILKYPDTDKPYTIFTDVSKYGWAGVLTQEHTTRIEGKQVTTNHPVAYVSGMFHGSQLNWAAMTKEANTIYMTVKKSTFYLTGAEITLRSDHLPLNKFLQKNTLNIHINNWAVEIESFKIKFVHIASKDNVIADTLSHLIDIDPDIILEPELKDYEFGSYCFENLPKARRSSVAEKLASVDGVDVCEISITYNNDENSPNSVEMPLPDEKFSQLQGMDEKINNLRVRVSNGEYPDFYKIENNILYHMVIENNHKFDAAVLPAKLVNTALILGHNQSGHNGFQRTYAAIKRIYYWKGMHKDILRYCKGCSQCAKHWVEKRKFIEQSFKPGVQPMEFISMDLVGEFHPPSSKGNRYALTAVCMLTNFAFCIPLKNKSASEIVTAWRNHIAFPFGVSRKILTDNGTEFKNSLFAEVAKELGLERKNLLTTIQTPIEQCT